MRTQLSGAVLILVASASCFGQVKAPPPTTKPVGFARWEKEIAAYEAADRANPPTKGGILFTGASSIRKWTTLAQDFPEHQVLNRGFGGSNLADSTHFAERIIFPYEPRMVLLRAGGNDIHAGRTPRQVLEDYQAFVAKVHGRLPDIDIVFISQCPTPSRWNERDAYLQLNTMIEQFTRETPHLKYVETYDLVLDADGQVRRDLFVSDNQHFNAEGYKLMKERVRAVLPN